MIHAAYLSNDSDDFTFCHLPASALFPRRDTWMDPRTPPPKNQHRVECPDCLAIIRRQAGESPQLGLL